MSYEAMVHFCYPRRPIQTCRNGTRDGNRVTAKMDVSELTRQRRQRQIPSACLSRHRHPTECEPRTHGLKRLLKVLVRAPNSRYARKCAVGFKVQLIRETDQTCAHAAIVFKRLNRRATVAQNGHGSFFLPARSAHMPFLRIRYSNLRSNNRLSSHQSFLPSQCDLPVWRSYFVATQSCSFLALKVSGSTDWTVQTQTIAVEIRSSKRL